MKKAKKIIAGAIATGVAGSVALWKWRKWKKAKDLKNLIHRNNLRSIKAFELFLKANGFKKSQFCLLSEDGLTPIYGFADDNLNNFVAPKGYILLSIILTSTSRRYAVADKLDFNTNLYASTYRVLFYIDVDYDKY